ncbi:MAG: DivIVA domain-containing protein [Oscillospiraceae bacterium]|nr:DivIVA domain-containing protein [Oscillospiraceae bacterium]
MLTAEAIRNVKFISNLNRYKANEVDAFLDECADTVQALTGEQMALSKKMGILADKLLEYREEEDSIRNALLSAQRLGDATLKEANQKADAIREDARAAGEKIVETAKSEATAIIREARARLKAEAEEFNRLKKEVALFRRRMLAFTAEYVAQLERLPAKEDILAEDTDQADTAAAPANAVPNTAADDPPADFAGDPPAGYDKKPAREPAGTPVFKETAAPGTNRRPKPAAVAEEIAASLKREPPAAPEAEKTDPRFADLRFGDDYDMNEETIDSPIHKRRYK